MFEKEIILASASPRRTEILNLGRVKHRIVVKEHEEIIDESKSAEDIVKDLAYQKAYAVYKDNLDEIVLGADTVVVLDGILGKPKDRDDAYRMLKKLSNKTHKVITGVAILSKDTKRIFSETTNVTFRKMTDEEIYEYIDNENVLDKAGAYAIQGMASKYISKIEGDYYNVMGLPISRVCVELENVLSNKRPKNYFVAVGGSNIDYIGNILGSVDQYQSNIGKVDLFFGGVSRNIVENLARNHVELSFITCIADDAIGKAMKQELEELGVDLYIPSNVSKTGSFLSVNNDNNLYVGICDVDYQDKLTIEYIESLNLITDETKYLLVDTNLPEDLIFHLCNKYQDKFIITDGISSKKVTKLLPVLDKISLLKVNQFEGKALTGLDKPELILKELINRKIKNCIITCGASPTLYNIGKELRLEPVIKESNIVNTTGAGDATLSGIIVGLLRNYSMQDAVKLGHVFANANLQVVTPTLKKSILKEK